MLSHTAKCIYRRETPPETIPNSHFFTSFLLFLPQKPAEGLAYMMKSPLWYLILIVPGKVTKCTVLHAIRGVYFLSELKHFSDNVRSNTQVRLRGLLCTQ